MCELACLFTAFWFTVLWFAVIQEPYTVAFCWHAVSNFTVHNDFLDVFARTLLRLVVPQTTKATYHTRTYAWQLQDRPGAIAQSARYHAN